MRWVGGEAREGGRRGVRENFGWNVKQNLINKLKKKPQVRHLYYVSSR